jgi:hypothetical protein
LRARIELSNSARSCGRRFSHSSFVAMVLRDSHPIYA